MDNSHGQPSEDASSQRVQGPASKAFTYVKDGLPVTEYVQVKKEASFLELPNADYHPTAIIVMCSCPGCRTIGTLEFPNGFDFKTGDRVMEKKTIRGMCLNCRTGKDHAVLDQHGKIVGHKPCIGPEVEFIPYGDACKLMEHSQEMVKHVMGIA